MPTGAREEPARRTQTQRRETTRAALIESAARGFSRDGFTALTLDRVATDAGYTRGALYHLFANKEELALAVIAWVNETWHREVGDAAADASDPLAALLAVARGHALYCRRHGDIGRVFAALSVEFGNRDHPVRDALLDVRKELLARLVRLIASARRLGQVPPGPPTHVLAQGAVGAMEGVAIWAAGRAPHDVDMAERVMRGILGVPPTRAG
jgi:AcrR family transcriptional regulator